MREGCDVLFEPDWEGRSKQGLVVFDSIHSRRRVFTPVQNTQSAVIQLETGVPLGVVEPCELEAHTASAGVHTI